MSTDVMVNIPAWDLREHRHIDLNVITCEQAIPLLKYPVL